ncbi:MAG: AtuA-related protein [Pyrinomonadaceae bacterium]
MKIELTKLAHARSGDKGDTANVGVIALKDEFYPILEREITAEKVKEHFGAMVKGEVERFELPNLKALNFLLHESLGGGGTLSLMTDAQGKTFSTALLRMKIDLEESEAENLGLK